MSTATSDINPDALKTVSENGTAPGSRLRHAHQAFEICDDLNRQDSGRRKKRGRIFKAYNRFPPKDYSTLWKSGPEWQSNVNFGMMAFVVDNNLSSFFDMLTERVYSAEIITKYGDPKDRAYFSEVISFAFDKMLREWDDYLINAEQDLLDMLLFGKGVEMHEDEEGCMYEHVSADDILVPEHTKVSLCNWTEIVVKRTYTLLELYEKIQDAKAAGEMGWNVKAVVNAMRYQKDSWSKKNSDDFLKAVVDGSITFGGHLKETVDVYILFVREFSGKVSKFITLQNYAPMFSLTRAKSGPIAGEKQDDWESKTIDSDGFLFSKVEYKDEIGEVFSVFMDCAGNGYWHRIPSLAEKIFVQCRQYDFTMNAIMDAIRVNMSLMLQASTADAHKKIKEMVFGPYTIIPSDVPFVQQRMELPTQEATTSLQFMMGDMYRGLGEYRVQQQDQKGDNPTATQVQHDASESAKLTGTQLKRFNGQCGFHYRRVYKKLVELGTSEEDYENCAKVFWDYLEENGVPKEAAKWENIESINSNMLAGAGSPSYKLMAAEKTLQITNIAPRDEGQANAMEDAIAALHGRGNVRRYIQKVQPDPTWNERQAYGENAMLGEIALNPQSVQVFPGDNHVFHLNAHLSDMEQTILQMQQMMQKAQTTGEQPSENWLEHAAYKLKNQGGHANAHLQYIMKDSLKEEEGKQFSARLNEIQRAADRMAQMMQEMKAAQKDAQKNYDPNSDPKVHQAIAIGQIQTDTAQKLADIKTASRAQEHAQKMSAIEDKTATEIAVARAKGATEIQIQKTKGDAAAKKPAAKKKSP